MSFALQVAAQQGIFLVIFRFVGVEPFIGVAQVDVQLCLLRLHPLHVERLEGRPVLGDILQHPDVEADAAGIFPYHRAFLQVRLQYALERTGHHRFLLPALPFFRCQGCFLLAHLPFHTGVRAASSSRISLSTRSICFFARTSYAFSIG